MMDLRRRAAQLYNGIIPALAIGETWDERETGAEEWTGEDEEWARKEKEKRVIVIRFVPVPFQKRHADIFELHQLFAGS